MPNGKTPRPSINELKEHAWDLRRDILLMLREAGSGHTGGSLSCAEILVALYHYKLHHDPHNPQWEERDRFILSKGHCCPALYTVLAHRGFFPREDLFTFRKIDSRLQGHAYAGVPGVEVSTGSLGQGLSIANGLALAARADGKKNRIYCLMGDGEMDEGQIWEAAMTAGFRRLDNLCGIVDLNGIQQDSWTREIKDLRPVDQKWSACGWHVLDVDGHDPAGLLDALDSAADTKGKPVVIIARTVKGKGVSFMENNPVWHGKAPNQQELEKALQELEATRMREGF
ncbi:MAG: Transketolase [Dehalococcoidia bacterium]|nr:Transketolase [Dehalococcoidia bacterium]